MISRNDLCYCGSGKKWKKCHFPLQPSQTFDDVKKLYRNKYQIFLKTKAEIQGIRKACQFTAKLLKTLCEHAKEGVSTLELDALARDICKQAKVIPASLGYGHPPFPAAICTSLNEVICHGIPSSVKLKEGDIMNIDVACIVDGYFGDCSAMVSIGNVTEDKKRVVTVAFDAMMQAIHHLKPGLLVSEIGTIISNHAHAHGCSVVDAFVSHGVGLFFHEEPQIAHFPNNNHIPLAPGMTFTIEPMINVGVKEAVIDPFDHWTARTADGKPSAQWEHTVLITEDGHEILTLA